VGRCHPGVATEAVVAVAVEHRSRIAVAHVVEARSVGFDTAIAGMTAVEA
tara:strand:- start:27864 stop:28013 length:150 start_codon:yes stop_codon:yes gene_type:complete